MLARSASRAAHSAVRGARSLARRPATLAVYMPEPRCGPSAAWARAASSTPPMDEKTVAPPDSKLQFDDVKAVYGVSGTCGVCNSWRLARPSPPTSQSRGGTPRARPARQSRWRCLMGRRACTRRAASPHGRGKSRAVGRISTDFAPAPVESRARIAGGNAVGAAPRHPGVPRQSGGLPGAERAQAHHAQPQGVRGHHHRCRSAGESQRNPLRSPMAGHAATPRPRQPGRADSRAAAGSLVPSPPSARPARAFSRPGTLPAAPAGAPVFRVSRNPVRACSVSATGLPGSRDRRSVRALSRTPAGTPPPARKARTRRLARGPSSRSCVLATPACAGFCAL